jgi:UDP-N-acetylmuramoyl-tripeptide--D-alanyl-D-alanine ligase
LSTLLTAGLAVGSVGVIADSIGRTRRWLHLFQLEHYEPARLMNWWRRRGDVRRPLHFAASVVALGGATASAATGGELLALVLLALLGAASLAIGYREWRQDEKKPLVFTPRARRLFLTSLAPAALLFAVTLAIVVVGASSATAVAVLIGGGVAATAAAPLSLVVANVMLLPLERRINRRYIYAARAKLEAIAPLTIGITGSYGKTTTKFCVGRVLSTSRETLVTPESFNSLLGVTRTVNERLGPVHEAFVVEMGAYRRGDINELCELVHPTIGILTAIGPMHLERFGSIEAIRDTKAELLASLPADGHFITNGDDPHCRSLAASAHVAVTLFAVDAHDADVRASDIRISAGRTSFTLWLGTRPYPVEAHLLGLHNVRNLLAAAACGLVTGVADADIVRAVEAVDPPPHRLAAIVNGRTGVVVIDDAYNSNPEGAASALDVLAEHEAGRRVLVTPGMVELGSEQEAANLEFGRHAARVCDLVLLVGPDQTQPIRRGLLEGGFESDQIIVVDDLGQATKQLTRLVNAGDVVLFENDLPDTYITRGRAREGGAKGARERPLGVPLRR